MIVKKARKALENLKVIAQNDVKRSMCQEKMTDILYRRIHEAKPNRSDQED